MGDLDYNYIKIGELEGKSIYIMRDQKLFKLTKEEQTIILNELGVKDIPKLEKDRVDMIIRLKGGNK